MRGAGARLRANIAVTQTELSEGMRAATRRVPVSSRHCGNCGEDISARPKEHTLCYECWSEGASATKRMRRQEECTEEEEDSDDDTEDDEASDSTE